MKRERLSPFIAFYISSAVPNGSWNFATLLCVRGQRLIGASGHVYDYAIPVAYPSKARIKREKRNALFRGII